VGGGEEGLWGREREREAKNRVFHVDERIYNLQVSLSELVSLSEIQLLALNTTFHVEQNFSVGWNCA